MPLSAPVARQHLHTRRVTCTGYFRDDGLFDIEGQITDEKTYEQDNEWRGTLKPGDYVHNMSIRLTIDRKMVIHDVEACTDHSPYRICGDVAPNFKALVGLRISGGFLKQARERVGGTKGCTHIVELLGPVGTTAYQTISSDKADELSRDHWHKELAARGESPPAKRQLEVKDYRAPSVMNTCHAWAEDGQVIRRWAPLFYTGPDREKVRAEAEARVKAGLPPEA